MPGGLVYIVTIKTNPRKDKGKLYEVLVPTDDEMEAKLLAIGAIPRARTRLDIQAERVDPTKPHLLFIGDAP